MFTPVIAGAQDGDDADSSTEERVRPDPSERIAEALQPLVDDGTLTEAQVEAQA